MHVDRVAILLDGEFVKKILSQRRGRFPSAADIAAEVDRIRRGDGVRDHQLHRVFFSTADPFAGTRTNPMSGDQVRSERTAAHRRNRSLTARLELLPDFAVRRGTLVHLGWQLRPAFVRRLKRGEQALLQPDDVIPRLEQKGVDMRAGLDIASLALKRLVGTVILVAGDADFIPALKLARREGLKVFLDTLGASHVRGELRVHADRVIAPEA